MSLRPRRLRAQAIPALVVLILPRLLLLNLSGLPTAQIAWTNNGIQLMRGQCIMAGNVLYRLF